MFVNGIGLLNDWLDIEYRMKMICHDHKRERVESTVRRWVMKGDAWRGADGVRGVLYHYYYCCWGYDSEKACESTTKVPWTTQMHTQWRLKRNPQEEEDSLSLLYIKYPSLDTSAKYNIGPITFTKN